MSVKNNIQIDGSWKISHFRIHPEVKTAFKVYVAQHNFQNYDLALDAILREKLMNNAIVSDSVLANNNITIKPHQPITAQKND